MFTKKTTTTGVKTIDCNAAELLDTYGVNLSFAFLNTQMEAGTCFGILKPTEEEKKPKLTVKVTIKKRRQLMPVAAYGHMDQAGQSSINMLEVSEENEENATYTHSVPLEEVDGKLLPKWPANRFYILCEKQNGLYELFLVGFMAQDFQVWSWAELADSGRIEWDSDGNATVDTPSVIWKQLIKALGESGRYNRRALYDADNGKPVFPEGMDTLPKGQGIMQYFNPFMGTGYCWYKTSQGRIESVKVHYSAIQERGAFGLRRLNGGDIVSGQMLLAPHSGGPQKGGMRHELKFVQKVS